ncbi:MAG: hypothetical protein IT385_01770 [Deltaproteobacteria bacterium]|nr:hypothetical protein [Deltaproteobacteria bacterium]
MTTRHTIPIACVVLAALAGCDELDGGLVPVDRLPPPTMTAPGDATSSDGDTTAAPSVTIVSPADGATVDADWIAVGLEVTGVTLDATHAIALTVIPPSPAEPVTTLVREASAVLPRVPSGSLTIRATLVEGTTPTEIGDEVSVTAERTPVGVTFVTPSDGATVAAGGDLAVELALTGFTLLAADATPSGPRQGRILLALDDDEAGQTLSATTTTITTPAMGAHELTATLVDAAGEPWDAGASATVGFEVGAPPSVAIVSPAPDDDIEGARLTVEIAPQGFVTDGASTPGHGTFAVTLDDQLVLDKRTGTRATLTGLAAGEHTLTVELTTAEGTSLTPAVTASVSFSSQLLPPGVDLVLPTGTRVEAGPTTVAILPHHFTLTSSLPIPGPLVPATGAWQLLVDDVVVNDLIRTAQSQVVLTAGARKLTARLVDTTGQPLDPAVAASRTLEVEPLATAVQILAPRPGTPVAKRFAVAVAIDDFTLSQDVLAPGQPAVPGVGHFHAFLRKVPDTTWDYQGFYLTETFELEVAEAGQYDLKIALHYQNHEAVSPPVEAIVRFDVDARPGVRILGPIEGARIGPAPFAVAVQVDNFELIPVGEVSTVKGHYHLFIDGAYQGFFVTPTAVLDPLTVTPALTPGAHTLSAFLHDSNHEPIPGTASDSVSFTYDAKPTVRILSPAGGARVSTDPFVIQVAVEDLKLVDKAGQAAVPGEGHLHVFVDNAYIDFETSSRFELAIAEAGAHTIKVTLHDNDHAAIEGAAPAFVNVLVDPTPRVRVVAPAEGTFVYAGELVPLLAADNHDGDVELVIDDELVFVGDPGMVEPIVLAEGTHVARVTPVDDEGEPVAGAAVESVTFEVVGLEPPTITWVAPNANATVVAGQSVTIGATGMTLAGGVARRPGVPGDGLWTLTAGEATFGPFATPSVALPALPRGATTLVAELWHRDGSRVMPRSVATLPVTVGGATPGLSLRSPTPEGQRYGPSVEVVMDVSAFELGPTAGWVAIRVDGGIVGLVSRPSALVGPFAPGLHTIEVELIGGDGQPLTPRVQAGGTFRVGGAATPTLAITSPADGATLTGDGVAVAFTLSGLSLDPGATNGPPQPGKGAVLVLVDGLVRAIATSSPVTLSDLAPGRRRIELVAAGLDLVPLEPRVGKSIEVIVP